MTGTLTPERTAARLCELSSDARAAVLLDAAGSLAGSSMSDPGRAEALAQLTRELFETVDRATRDWDADPAEQVEVQVPGGAAYASRTPRWTLAVVARRGALSSLMLYDLRAVLGELEGGPPIRVAAAADARGAEPASEEDAASDLPLPELGRDVEDDAASSGRGNTPRRRAGGSARRSGGGRAGGSARRSGGGRAGGSARRPGRTPRREDAP